MQGVSVLLVDLLRGIPGGVGAVDERQSLTGDVVVRLQQRFEDGVGEHRFRRCGHLPHDRDTAVVAVVTPLCLRTSRSGVVPVHAMLFAGDLEFFEVVLRRGIVGAVHGRSDLGGGHRLGIDPGTGERLVQIRQAAGQFGGHLFGVLLSLAGGSAEGDRQSGQGAVPTRGHPDGGLLDERRRQGRCGGDEFVFGAPRQSQPGRGNVLHHHHGTDDVAGQAEVGEVDTPVCGVEILVALDDRLVTAGKGIEDHGVAVIVGVVDHPELVAVTVDSHVDLGAGEQAGELVAATWDPRVRSGVVLRGLVDVLTPQPLHSQLSCLVEGSAVRGDDQRGENECADTHQGQSEDDMHEDQHRERDREKPCTVGNDLRRQPERERALRPVTCRIDRRLVRGLELRAHR